MALQKDKTLDTGVVGNYWRLINLTIDRVANSAILSLALYLTKASRDSGMAPLDITQYNWSDGAFPFTTEAMDANNPIKIAYDTIVATDPFFSDAQNV